MNVDNGNNIKPTELGTSIFCEIYVFLISVLHSYLTQPKVASLATFWEWKKVDAICVIISMTFNHPPPIHP